MQATIKKIEDYFQQNGSTIGMISRDMIVAFLEETIESYGITSEKWNFTHTKSYLA